MAIEPLPLPDDEDLPGAEQTPGESGATRERAADAIRPLAILIALLLAAETVLAAVLAAGKVLLDFQTNTGFPDAPTDYMLWLALASDVVFFAAVLVLAIATVAVWQEAFGRGRLVGRTKRAAVWSALFLQVMLLIPFEPLLPASIRPVSDPGTNALPVAIVLVIGAGLAWTLRREAFRGMDRRTIAGVVATVAIMVVVGTASLGYAERTDAVSFAQSLGGLVAPSDLVPAKNTMCRGSITEACARRAADRVHRSFAWIPFAASPRLRVVAVRSKRHAIAYESSYVPSHLMTIELESGTIAGQPLGSPVRTVSDGNVVATVRLDKGYDGYGGILQIVWTRNGQTFEMDGSRLIGPGLTSGEIDSLIAFWRQVRYAEPTTSGRSGSSANGGA